MQLQCFNWLNFTVIMQNVSLGAKKGTTYFIFLQNSTTFVKQKWHFYMICIIFMQNYLESNAKCCIFASVKLNKNTQYEIKS